MPQELVEDRTEVLRFRNKLMDWARDVDRPMPWKNEKDPYKIWLSEIILQQTRVEQGTQYYLKFTEQYPSVEDLAASSMDDVLKNWQGLGYNSRARNLLESARQIVSQFGGEFPRKYKEIISLKGIGEYTASAIASFAFNLPHAVVDGNVKRVLSRYFKIDNSIDLPASKKVFQQYADKLLDKSNPAQYNQAIMDFGALICKPKQPNCDICPLNENCLAFQSGEVKLFPKKTLKKKKRTRYFYYFVITNKKGVFLKKRSSNDIWKFMYDFPLLETAHKISHKDAVSRMKKNQGFEFLHSSEIDFSVEFKQELTHQKIYSFFLNVSIIDEKLINIEDAEFAAVNDLKKKPFPRTISWYFEKNHLTLFSIS